MKYVTEDNKVFDTEKEAKEHEKDLAAAKVKQEEFEKNRNARRKEVNDAYENYRKLLKEYIKDYDTYSYSSKDEDGYTLSNLFESIFG